MERNDLPIFKEFSVRYTDIAFAPSITLESVKELFTFSMYSK